MVQTNRTLKPITIAAQKYALKERYGGLVTFLPTPYHQLLCRIVLTPSPHSCSYVVKVSYGLYWPWNIPKVFLLSPALQRRDNQKIPHLYEYDSQGHARLCVYDPHQKEFRPQQLLADSFVPWILTWLNTYEFWLLTGQWIYSQVHAAPKKDPVNR